ncbi:hypothetical protein L9F63_018503 [Diploptera punctata]|uniref:Large ribosomal subunit protein bL21m n=1 Tax=Diploptera punctata TaxID=6984 RepID=A0AAD8EF32_DIPPU|nr:hypothetical protein L9F63_018503 [Diploptera punctata]
MASICNQIGKLLLPNSSVLLRHTNNVLNIQGSIKYVPQWTCARFQSELKTQKMIEFASVTKEDLNLSKEIVANVNKQLSEKQEGRLFAVVHISGKQFKVTTEDLVIIQGHWAPQIGDRLKLEKVLLVGGTDFTLVGRPVLSTDLVTVTATVVEKTLSTIKTVFKKIPRKQNYRFNFTRTPFTTLRINTITVKPELDVKKDVEGLEGRIF